MTRDQDRTFVIIKPDAVQRKLVGKLLDRIEREPGVELLDLWAVAPTRKIVEEHYQEHRGKPFFDGLVEFMTSQVVCAVFEGHDVVTRVRELIGPTDHSRAPSGTLRGDFSDPAAPIRENLVHASDSPQAVQREHTLWLLAR